MYNTIWLVNSTISFYLNSSQLEFFSHKKSGIREELSDVQFFFRQNCNKSLWKNIFLVSFHLHTSHLVSAPLQLIFSPSPTTCEVDNFQPLIFGNGQSPEKFTGKPKIVSHLTSSQEILKHKSIFTFTLHTIYPSMRSMAQPDIKAIYQRRVSTCHQ